MAHWATPRLFMTMEKCPVPPQKSSATTSNGASTKKTWKQPVKAEVKTVMPEGVTVQVHKRESLPENYRICNGTSFETYQPQTWGR